MTSRDSAPQLPGTGLGPELRQRFRNVYRQLLTRRLRPSFLILGTEKGGTTSFFYYLARHPQLTPPREKEICFFSKDAIFQRGLPWYHRRFPTVPRWSRQISYEADPSYFYYPGVASRVASYDPEMKLIVMLRDPVARAYSAWNMHRQLRVKSWDVVLQRLETQPEAVRQAMLDYYDRLVAAGDFPAAIRELISRIDDDRVEPGLLKRGLYARQLAEFQRHFPANRILVLESSRCRTDSAAELDRLARFVGIDCIDWAALPVPEESHHKRSYEAPLGREAEQLLREFYRQPNEDLFALLGERFPWNDPLP